MHETSLTPALTAPPATAMEALQSVSWLGAVASATMERLAGHAMVIRLPKGAQIFDQAEIPSFAQFLLAGSIELLAVRGDEETLVELARPVDALLPAAVLGALPYLVRARVREDAVLLLVQAEAFRAAVAADQALCLAMLACQSTQFRRQMKLAKAIRLRSAEERVGGFLLALAKAQPGTGEIRLPLEKRQIASQLGMTRETFSRALPGPAKHGLRVSGDRLFVEDIDAAGAAYPYDALIDGRDEITPLAVPGDSK
jgi:CRP/FNR family transcriptional activator FtrB